MTDPALPIATAFIAQREGFRAEPYRDNGRGVWTIGYGFTYLSDGRPVTADTPAISESDAYARLTEMVASVLACVRKIVTAQISDNAAAALASFAYNEGKHALEISNILRHVNAGDMQAAAGCFASWVYAGGHIDPGLVNRRRDEAALFLTPDAETTAVTADELNAAELQAIEGADAG